MYKLIAVDLDGTLLNSYGEVAKQFMGLTPVAIKDEVIAVNDGNGIQDLSDGQVSIIRKYTDNVATSGNMGIEDYYSSNTIENDINILSKSSVFMNNIKNYSSEGLNKILVNILSKE